MPRISGRNRRATLREFRRLRSPVTICSAGAFLVNPSASRGTKAGFEDARGTLLYEILRIARHHCPAVLFLENVKNFLGHADGRTLETTLELLESLGYEVHYSVLNASRYGVAQKRERIYFVCFRKDLGVSGFQFPSPLTKTLRSKTFFFLRMTPSSTNWLSNGPTSFFFRIPRRATKPPFGASARWAREGRGNASTAPKGTPLRSLPSGAESGRRPECIWSTGASGVCTRRSAAG